MELVSKRCQIQFFHLFFFCFFRRKNAHSIAPVFLRYARTRTCAHVRANSAERRVASAELLHGLNRKTEVCLYNTFVSPAETFARGSSYKAPSRTKDTRKNACRRCTQPSSLPLRALLYSTPTAAIRQLPAFFYETCLLDARAFSRFFAFSEGPYVFARIRRSSAKLVLRVRARARARSQLLRMHASVLARTRLKPSVPPACRPPVICFVENARREALKGRVVAAAAATLGAIFSTRHVHGAEEYQYVAASSA